MTLAPDHWLRTAPLHTRAEVVGRPCPVPASPGVYAWFFRDLFPGMELADRLTRDGFTLLYVGISPSREAGTSGLRVRLRTHCRGNAYASTLRLSLGSLLCGELSLFPQYRNGRLRPIFGEGEVRLSAWMDENTRVTWHEHPAPWDEESALIRELDLPLNLRENERHPFYPRLRAARKALGRVGG
jgi:hypothetical protein